MEQNELLLINEECEEILNVNYIKEVDNKLNNKDIFKND